MFSTTTLILTGLLCLFVGLLLGALIQDRLTPSGQRNRQNELKHKKSEDELLHYQQDVSEHFLETARKLGQVTQQYRELCEHLADSALNLSNPDLRRRIVDASNGKLSDDELSLKHYAEDDSQAVDVPRDWAPRSPGQKGLLDEDYGLDTQPEAESTTKTQ